MFRCERILKKSKEVFKRAKDKNKMIIYFDNA